jgi:hypothetical protein
LSSPPYPPPGLGLYSQNTRQLVCPQPRLIRVLRHNSLLLFGHSLNVYNTQALWAEYSGIQPGSVQ